MEMIAKLAQLIMRHALETGICGTPVRHLSLIRTNELSAPVPAVYEASLCLIAQGAKRVSLGEHSVVYDASRYLLVSVDLPLVGHVLEASPEMPYLCCKIDLDLTVLADLLVDECGEAPRHDLPVLAVYPGDPDLIDAACRLVSLLDHPSDIAVLAPLIEREILYRLLTGPHGPLLRQMASADSHLNQINRA
uniref:AraC family transcriptional regulator n=1 Tax=Castellaniella sp. TaxID=1955812 RepID=UPI002B003280